MAPATSSSVMLYMCAAAFLAIAAHATDDAHHQTSVQDRRCGDDFMKLCESTLRSDKQSTTAKNTRDLALVAMDLLLRTTTKVDSVLRRHSGSGHHSRSTALTLQYCQLDYAAIARTVPKCRAMVKEYKPIYPPNPEVGNVYYNCVAMLGQAASDCWGYVLGSIHGGRGGLPAGHPQFPMEMDPHGDPPRIERGEGQVPPPPARGGLSGRGLEKKSRQGQGAILPCGEPRTPLSLTILQSFPPFPPPSPLKTLSSLSPLPLGEWKSPNPWFSSLLQLLLGTWSPHPPPLKRREETTSSCSPPPRRDVDSSVPSSLLTAPINSTLHCCQAPAKKVHNSLAPRQNRLGCPLPLVTRTPSKRNPQRTLPFFDCALYFFSAAGRGHRHRHLLLIAVRATSSSSSEPLPSYECATLPPPPPPLELLDPPPPAGLILRRDLLDLVAATSSSSTSSSLPPPRRRLRHLVLVIAAAASPSVSPRRADVPVDGGVIHGVPIPPGYARVNVDRFLPGWEDLDLEIEGGDGEKEKKEAWEKAPKKPPPVPQKPASPPSQKTTPEMTRKQFTAWQKQQQPKKEQETKMLHQMSGLPKVLSDERSFSSDVTEHPQLLMGSPTGHTHSLSSPLWLYTTLLPAAIHLSPRSSCLCARERCAAMDGSKNTIHGLQFWMASLSRHTSSGGVCISGATSFVSRLTHFSSSHALLPDPPPRQFHSTASAPSPFTIVGCGFLIISTPVNHSRHAKPPAATLLAMRRISAPATGPPCIAARPEALRPLVRSGPFLPLLPPGAPVRAWIRDSVVAAKLDNPSISSPVPPSYSLALFLFFVPDRIYVEPFVPTGTGDGPLGKEHRRLETASATAFVHERGPRPAAAVLRPARSQEVTQILPLCRALGPLLSPAAAHKSRARGALIYCSHLGQRAFLHQLQTSLQPQG
ncbi:hypothetical protein HU200_021534 [Digitaria exilis]|uniref:DUF8039 domain-containing protein n=1 Tax=Digitaria exilis TaxID=1010633 RepID=A0A835EZB9_9POAL|nr:hypothetical protein HU200_021534 [Digitaria exilis]